MIRSVRSEKLEKYSQDRLVKRRNKILENLENVEQTQARKTLLLKELKKTKAAERKVSERKGARLTKRVKKRKKKSFWDALAEYF